MNKADSNRLNALKSTGPKTEAGKNRSRLNAWKHGFTAQLVLATDEEGARYQAHLKKYVKDLDPRCPVQACLVEALAENSWWLSVMRARFHNWLSQIGFSAPNPNGETANPEVNAAASQAAMFPEILKQMELFARFEQRKMKEYRDNLDQLMVENRRYLLRDRSILAPKRLTPEELTEFGFDFSNSDPTPAPEPETPPSPDPEVEMLLRLIEDVA